MIPGNGPWQKIFLRLVDVFLLVPEYRLLMHTSIRSVRLGYAGASQDASDVYCICGCCAFPHSGPRKWVPLDVSVVEAWPTLGLQSLRVYKPCKKRRGADTRKPGERYWVPIFAPMSVEAVDDPNPVDPNASFQAEVPEAPPRVQRERPAKLKRWLLLSKFNSVVNGQAPSSSTSSSSHYRSVRDTTVEMTATLMIIVVRHPRVAVLAQAVLSR